MYVFSSLIHSASYHKPNSHARPRLFLKSVLLGCSEILFYAAQESHPSQLSRVRLSGQKSLKGEPAKVKLKLPSVLSRPIAGQSLPSSGHPGVHTLSESFHPRLALVGLHAVLVPSHM